jgi:hypothetical protein
MLAGTADGVCRAGEPRLRVEDLSNKLRQRALARAKGRYDSTPRRERESHWVPAAPGGLARASMMREYVEGDDCGARTYADFPIANSNAYDRGSTGKPSHDFPLQRSSSQRWSPS